jgi:hypothetical protein
MQRGEAWCIAQEGSRSSDGSSDKVYVQQNSSSSSSPRPLRCIQGLQRRAVSTPLSRREERNHPPPRARPPSRHLRLAPSVSSTTQQQPSYFRKATMDSQSLMPTARTTQGTHIRADTSRSLLALSVFINTDNFSGRTL